MVALLTSGCDRVFTLDRNFDDAPSTNNPCTRPDLESYTYATVPKWGGFPGFLFHPAIATDQQVYFTDDGGKIYSSSLDNQTAVVSFSEPGFIHRNPSLSHDSRVLFFSRRMTTDEHVDVRVWDRTQPTTTLGTAMFDITGIPPDPGNAAHYGGEHRMVIFQVTAKPNHRLVEMRSTDLSTWTEVQPPTIAWSVGNREDIDASLTRDGCVLVFASNRHAQFTDLYISMRQGDGTFAQPERLPISDPNYSDRGPTISPDGRFWFLRHKASQELIVGAPP